MNREYKVFFEHEDRYAMDAGKPHQKIERVEVAVFDVPDAMAAISEAKDTLAKPERWKVRCVTLTD